MSGVRGGFVCVKFSDNIFNIKDQKFIQWCRFSLHGEKVGAVFGRQCIRRTGSAEADFAGGGEPEAEAGDPEGGYVEAEGDLVGVGEVEDEA